MTLLPAPAIYCLASEYDRLSPEQASTVTHILIDDGDWSPEQISTAIHGLPDPSPLPDDWTRL